MGSRDRHRWHHRGDEAYFLGAAGARGLRGWISDLIPEWGILVLAKGLLGEATPRAIAADHHVVDGQTLLEDFVVIESPGHTPGHVSYFYRPERALFAGDALAVIHDEIRFMARPVTLDLGAARASMEKCLRLLPDGVCPGHREPLTPAARGVRSDAPEPGIRWSLAATGLNGGCRTPADGELR